MYKSFIRRIIIIELYNGKRLFRIDLVFLRNFKVEIRLFK